MARCKVQKQISIFLPISDWRLLRLTAAQQRIPITELCRRWMKPELDRLQQQASLANDGAADVGGRIP